MLETDGDRMRQMGNGTDTTMVMTCHCGARDGFTSEDAGNWWICAKCRLPAAMYAASKLKSLFEPRGTEDDMSLVYFEGGPLNGSAYETSTLLSNAAMSLPIMEYVWTSEKKTSAATGAVAQIWRHKQAVAEAAVPVAVPVVQPGNTAIVSQDLSDQSLVPAVPESPEVQQPVEQAVTGVVQPGAPVSAESTESSALDGADLLRRRKNAKASRGVVSERSGLALSKITNIEQGTGKRITDADRQVLADTIAAIEAERGIGVDASAHA